MIAGLQRILGPARAEQNSRARSLENRNAGWFAILRIVRNDEGDVRLVQLTDLTLPSIVMEWSVS